ncbi:MAG: methyltransferase domain-containing protein [Acidobacteriales bacterium]|nr:MAG: methyltransferase domain-containing protein [Terriglobales bacterium]
MIPSRTRGDALELLDQPNLDFRELCTSLRDVGRLNRWFGGAQAIVSEVARIVKQRGLTGTITVLDIGTGGADIPRRLIRWGARHGLSVRVVACDRHEQIVTAAAAFSAGSEAISILRADALALPLLPGHFDFVTCSLMLHHLADDDAVTLLERLRDAPRHALIVCDLVRSRRARAGVWLAAHLVCRSRVTRHDGPLSVLRSFTVDELRALSHRAGCAEMLWFRRRNFRVVGVLEKGLR